MNSLSFPDVNVWVALALNDHTHHRSAWRWWEEDQSDVIAFSRFTQLGLLRLLTTSAIMQGNPLSMRNAWAVYDDLAEDERVGFVAEPGNIERPFRKYSSTRFASPNLWADAYLAAMAQELSAALITFDAALARRVPSSVLLA
jgi:toxin-antitoxin system PIN domain toxin